MKQYYYFENDNRLVGFTKITETSTSRARIEIQLKIFEDYKLLPVGIFIFAKDNLLKLTIMNSSSYINSCDGKLTYTIHENIEKISRNVSVNDIEGIVLAFNYNDNIEISKCKDTLFSGNINKIQTMMEQNSTNNIGIKVNTLDKGNNTMIEINAEDKNNNQVNTLNINENVENKIIEINIPEKKEKSQDNKNLLNAVFYKKDINETTTKLCVISKIIDSLEGAEIKTKDASIKFFKLNYNDIKNFNLENNYISILCKAYVDIFKDKIEKYQHMAIGYREKLDNNSGIYELILGIPCEKGEISLPINENFKFVESKTKEGKGYWLYSHKII